MSELPPGLVFYGPILIFVVGLALEIGTGVALNRGSPMLLSKVKHPREYWATVVFHAVIVGLILLVGAYIAITAPDMLPPLW